MPIRVQVPGHGIVEFPDGTSQADMAAALSTLGAPSAPKPTPGILDQAANAAKSAGSAILDAGIGAAKGAASTALGVGELEAPLLRKIPGLRGLVASPQQFDAARQAFTTPTTTAQTVGKTGEQIGEFFVPGGATEDAARAVTDALSKTPGVLARVLPKAAIRGATDATIAAAQGANPEVAGAIGAVSAPVEEGVRALAPRVVRSAIKAPLTALKQTANASRTGVNPIAQRLAKFIVDNRLVSPDKAEQLIQDAEREVQSMVGSQPTDAPARAMRYLDALKRSTLKQMLPGLSPDQIDQAEKDLLAGPMGETQYVTVVQPHPSLVDAQGKPIMVQAKEPVRMLRDTVPADEALSTARGTGRWETKRAYGELKGVSTEAQKASERAARDAVKSAVPETRPIFQRQSQGILAKQVLDRAANREGNKDLLSLPANVIAGGELAAGHVPALAAVYNLLRKLGVRGGVYLDQLLAPAVGSAAAPGVIAQATKP